MADACIICLGDLDDDGPAKGPLPANGALEFKEGATDKINPPLPSAELTTVTREEIAQILPCHHHLHNECLRPWIERANTCPVCRAIFNEVEVIHRIGGPVISSYAVVDKVQEEADFDPSLLDDGSEEGFDPCQICQEEGGDDFLLLCDGCDQGYHTWCIGLDAVPDGSWFCRNCVQSSTRMPAPRSSSTRPARTQSQLRRMLRDNATHFTLLRQTVWDRLNIDLDSPFDNRAPVTSQLSRRASRRRYPSSPRGMTADQWQRRLILAERQGGSRWDQVPGGAAAAHMTRARQRHEEPVVETAAEALAWKALDQAREMDANPKEPRKRKSAPASPADRDMFPPRRTRRSFTSSPAESSLQAERPLKRPRTRRTVEALENDDENIAHAAQPERPLKRPRTRRLVEASTSGHDGDSHPSPIRRESERNRTPTFLQSLLKEVQSSATPDDLKGKNRPAPLICPTPSDHSTPMSRSPGGSPAASNYATPRAMSSTPPPNRLTRPGSPIPLSSSVEPRYPHRECSFEQAGRDSSPARPGNGVQGGDLAARRRQSISRPPADASSPRSSSPSRGHLSFAAKEAVQKLVKEALKSPYKNKLISKDHYTEINKAVSRMLYERIGEDAAVLATQEVETWKKVAIEEVTKAMQSLRLEQT